MKIVHISTYDKIGGAAIAANRLNQAFRANLIDSQMLVLNCQNQKEDIIPLLKGKKLFLSKIKFLLILKLKQIFLRCSYTFSLGWFGYNFHSLNILKNADVIFIHWIGHGYMSIKEISKILKLNKPTVIYMHDMWLITGGCHHSFGCNKFMHDCHSCPNIKNKYLNGLSSITYHLKKKYLVDYNNLYIVTPSLWMNDCVKKSSIFKSSNINIIPHPIDSKLFKPIDRKEARNILNLPKGKKIILFGANGGKSDKYKGWDLLKTSISLLNRNDYAIILFGGYLTQEEVESFDVPIFSMGYIHDEYTSALLYNAVDVFVTPSLAESFGLTVQEAISCGTLVVGFKVGGIPDLVKHKNTGYLARYKDVDDFAKGINWALDNSNIVQRESLHLFIKKNFSYDIILNQYRKLFNC